MSSLDHSSTLFRKGGISSLDWKPHETACFSLALPGWFFHPLSSGQKQGKADGSSRSGPGHAPRLTRGNLGPVAGGRVGAGGSPQLFTMSPCTFIEMNKSKARQLRHSSSLHRAQPHMPKGPVWPPPRSRKQEVETGASHEGNVKYT